MGCLPLTFGQDKIKTYETSTTFKLKVIDVQDTLSNPKNIQEHMFTIHMQVEYQNHTIKVKSFDLITLYHGENIKIHFSNDSIIKFNKNLNSKSLSSEEISYLIDYNITSISYNLLGVKKKFIVKGKTTSFFISTLTNFEHKLNDKINTDLNEKIKYFDYGEEYNQSIMMYYWGGICLLCLLICSLLLLGVSIVQSETKYIINNATIFN